MSDEFRLFLRAKDEPKRQGWTLNYEMLERIEERIIANGANVSMEDIESVLLAVEPIIPDLVKLRELEELRANNQSEEE